MNDKLTIHSVTELRTPLQSELTPTSARKPLTRRSRCTATILVTFPTVKSSTGEGAARGGASCNCGGRGGGVIDGQEHGPPVAVAGGRIKCTTSTATIVTDDFDSCFRFIFLLHAHHPSSYIYNLSYSYHVFSDTSKYLDLNGFIMIFHVPESFSGIGTEASPAEFARRLESPQPWLRLL